MLSPDYREKGNRIQNKKKWAGHSEKVTHHKVCGPGSLEFGKAVKNIEGIFSFRFYKVMDIHSEILKSVGKRDFYGFDLRAVLY